MEGRTEKWVDGVVAEIERFRAAGFDEAVLTRRDWLRLHKMFPESLAENGSLVFGMDDGAKVKVFCGGSPNQA